MNAWSKKRSVMHRYDVTAAIYDVRYAEEQKAKIEAALQHVNSSFGTVLDAGCGTGLLFSHIADQASIMVGLDFSRKTLLKARERAKSHPSVDLLRGDADHAPLKDRVFDSVFAMTLIQNSPNQAQTLNEITRVARDNAIVVVTGLKKIFKRKAFEELLMDAGLLVSAMQSEGLKCYVAVCSKA